MTTRRGFLGAMLAACAAPAFVNSGVLMPVKTLWVLPQELILWSDGIHDDSPALQAFFDGDQVRRADNGTLLEGLLAGGTYLLRQTVTVDCKADAHLTGARLIGEIPGEGSMIIVPPKEMRGSRIARIDNCFLEMRPPHLRAIACS